MGKSCTMEGQPLSVRIFGKRINTNEAKNFKEEDFPQPGPCGVLHEPSFCGVEARLSIRNAYSGATVLITGGAGYVGSVVLEQLLRLCPEISRIYLLVRPKRGKTADDRIASLLRRPLFRELYVDGEIPAATMMKIVTLAGDLQEPQMGLTTADVKRLCAEVTHTIHSAASISFTDPVMSLMAQNYDATKRIAEVAAKMTQLKVFTHVSTAYVNSFKDQYSHIEEKIYPLPLRNGKLLDHVQVATELYSVDPVEADRRAATYVEETGLLNPYTLTKYMTEQLICEYHNRDFPVCIVRPSLVGSIAHFPVPGYFGNSAGSTAYLLAYGMGIATYSTHRPETIYDLIPGDLVGSTVVAATAAVAEKLTADGKDPVVVHACASTTNPIRHIRMFDDIVTPFWTEEPAKYRFTMRYTKSSDYTAYVTEGSILFHLLTLYHNIKFMIIGFLLRLFGMGALALKLWDGWTAWRTYNTERVDLQLFYCSRNAKMLESIIVPNERKYTKMIWTSKDDWIDYFFTHQWYIKQFFFNQQKKVK